MKDPYSIPLKCYRSIQERSATSMEASFDIIQILVDKLIERLDLFTNPINSILDSNSFLGYSTSLLEKKYKPKLLVAQELAHALVIKTKERVSKLTKQLYVNSSQNQLPYKNEVFDLVFSCFSLHWYSNIQDVLSEWYRVLQPESLVFFATLGPDSLKELYQACLMVDEDIHVNRFIEMHQLGDALIKAGFIDPVIDVERVVLQYSSVEALFKEIHQLGMKNINSGKIKALTGKNHYQKIKESYQQQFTIQGKIPATFEVIFAHAFVPKDKYPQISGEIAIPVERIIRKK